MPTQVVMPKLGESVVEGTVTRWLKAVGDTVEEFEPLLEVNTDKVDTEIPSPAGGTLLKILIPEDTTVKAGVILAWIGEPGETIPEGEAPEEPVSEPSAPVSPPAQKAAVAAPAPAPGRDRDLGFISPVVARIAREHNVDLTLVSGTGRGGRITKKDVLAFLESGPAAPAEEAVPPWETPSSSGGDLFRPTDELFGKEAARPAVTPPAHAPGSVIPHTPMRRAIAEHMVRSKHTSPHVTTVMEADMSRVARHRSEQKASFARDGVKLTFTAYLVQAVIKAIKAFPLVNSSWSDEGIVIRPEINIGMAASLGEEGLIVPVIKHADGLSLLGIARAVSDLANRARNHQLKPDEVTGGTFTITNHGTSGSLFATPIINQPQCAILGVGMIQKRVVVIDDAIAIRPMVYLSLTFDHRILDGALADDYLAKVVQILENWS